MSDTADIGQLANLDGAPPTPVESGRIDTSVRDMIRDAGKRAAAGEEVAAGAMMVADLDAPEPGASLGTPPAASKTETPAQPPTRLARAAAAIIGDVVPDEPPAERAPTRADAAAEVASRWDAIEERSKALEAREASIREREAKYGDVSERLSADPLGTLTELAKSRLGAGATEKEISDEVGYLITDASMRLAKIEPNEDDPKALLRKVQRELKQGTIAKQKAEEKAAALEKTRREEQEAQSKRQTAEQQFQGALGTVKREFTATVDFDGKAIEPLAKACPFLAVEDGYEEKIFALIKQDHDDQIAHGSPAASVEIMSIADAAKLLEQALAKRHREQFQKRQHLLQPVTKTAANDREHQGEQPRKLRSLSTADASEDAPPARREGPRTPAEDRAETMAILRQQGAFARLREAANSGD